MPMNDNVFRAILAMDSYNRGYNPSIAVPVATSIGTAQILDDSTERLGISRTSAVGFYASAYNWNGQTVISYRGTNFDLSDGEDITDSSAFRDIYNGWSVGAGFSSGSQAGLAIEFYQAVAGVTTPYYLIENPAASTILVGHSLGGGLAGFVGSLTYEISYGYDHMPFGLAALSQAVSDSIAAAARSLNITIDDLADAVDGSFSLFDLIAAGVAVQDSLDAYEREYALRTPYTRGLTGTHVDGEILEAVRDGTLQVFFGLTAAPSLGALFASPLLAALIGVTGIALGYTTAQLEAEISNTAYRTYGADLGGFIEGSVNRHSMPLLVTLLYGEHQWASEGGRGRADQWQAAAPAFLPALFDTDIAEALGWSGADPASQMATAIAYSAINEGERPFGDAGIRALFDDASDLGAAVVAGGNAPQSLRNAAPAVGRTITEFAGLLAVNRVVSEVEGAGQTGVLRHRDASGQSAETLLIDLRARTWGDHDIVSDDELIAGLLGTTLDGPALYAVINEWFRDNAIAPTGDLADNIDRVAIALSGGTQPARLGGEGMSLFVLSDAGNAFTYTARTDFVIGGTGGDVMAGLGGHDILIGGGGANRISGGDGRDFIAGGPGDDVLDGGNGADRLYSGGGFDQIYGGAGNDVIIFRGGFGLAVGGAGNDTYDGRFGAATVEYSIGDGRDRLEWSADFRIGSLRFDNFYERNLDFRGSVEVVFTDLNPSDVYIVFDTVVLDERLAPDGIERIIAGNMSIFNRANERIMDLGMVVGINQDSGGFDSYWDLLNHPRVTFADGQQLYLGELSNVEFRYSFRERGAQPADPLLAEDMFEATPFLLEPAGNAGAIGKDSLAVFDTQAAAPHADFRADAWLWGRDMAQTVELFV
jgi:hypothetical protein